MIILKTTKEVTVFETTDGVEHKTELGAARHVIEYMVFKDVYSHAHSHFDAVCEALVEHRIILAEALQILATHSKGKA